ncbi:hypothetical protein [Streptomyces sp. AP-93]|uniref:hypothetical protein n=1 Tax=Streptomyces sp. AP-93 TaxID=2929048 RepID=UPI001FAF2043|nr:hypothetical protein [Streptomyces sp. AP-93]MCJ0875837.1 hypothetical protein [Streptomyces sp. AP-93]
MAISRARKALFVGLASVLTASTAAIGVAYAVPGTVTTAAAAVAADEMPYAIEDFGYPNAATIEAERGIVLTRGDGNIVLVACGGTVDITVNTRSGEKDYCFDVKAKPGYLTLSVPKAFGIWTGDAPVKSTIEADGVKTVINAPANDFTSFGEATAESTPSALIELRVAG